MISVIFWSFAIAVPLVVDATIWLEGIRDKDSVKARWGGGGCIIFIAAAIAFVKG